MSLVGVSPLLFSGWVFPELGLPVVNPLVDHFR